MWGSKVGAVVLLAGIGFFGAYIPIVLRKCKIERFVCILNTFAAGRWKIWCLFAFFGGVSHCLLLPDFVRLSARRQNCFSSSHSSSHYLGQGLPLGAFLGLALFHIMPEAAEMLEKAELYIYVGKLRTPFNVAFLLIFVGYVVILLCEQVLTLGGEHGNSPRSARSEATTPRSLEGGWQGEERERGLRRDRTADDATVEIKVVCAPAAAVATDDTAADRRDASATGQEEAATAAEGQGAAAAAADASAEQGCTKALLGESLMGGSAAASAYDSSSSKRENVCVGEEVRGGGCGLGFPCCLMAEAAAREAAQQQGRDKAGRGATARAAGGRQAEAEGEVHSEKTGEAGDSTSKGRDAKGTRALVSGCCVLKQRQRHPRDSTRASAAGSDADDDDECSEVAAFVTTSQVAASGAREGMEKEFCLREDCGRAGGLQKGQEGKLKEGGTVCGVEGRQRQEEEQQSSAVRGVGQMASACRALMPRPCGNGSRDGDSATMFHPPEGLVQSYSVSTCGEAAAGTRETACDAGNLEAGAGGAAGGLDTGGAGGTTTAGGGKDGFEMAVVVRDIVERDKGAADLGGRLYEDSSRRAAKPEQRGRLHRWCRGFWKRPRAADVLQQHRQRQTENGEEERKRRRGRSWLFWCRCCPARVLTCLIPFAKQLDGGAVFLMAALAIHGLFEGFVVGAENNFMSLWILTCVIGAHKWAESLLLMTQFMDRHLSMTWAWTLVTIFVASSPIGIIVGTCVSSESRVAAGVCNALGAGTLLFVAAEVSAQVFTGDRKHRLLQLLVYCAGAGMVLGLSLLDLALEPEA